MTLLVCVDDIVLTSNNSQASKDFKSYLYACLSIKDLGVLKYFLGIEVAQGPEPEGLRVCFCVNENMP